MSDEAYEKNVINCSIFIVISLDLKLMSMIIVDNNTARWTRALKVDEMIWIFHFQELDIKI